jgi:hypothetical protein
MVELGLEGSQTRLDVAEAFAEGQLGEGEAEELIPAREAARATVAAIPPHARVEVVAGQEIHELSEHELPGVHESSSVVWDGLPDDDSDDPRRYRARSFCDLTDYLQKSYVKFRER